MDNSLNAATLRMLDANFNRASEGLRTLEDIARFVLNRQDWCSAYKEVRHQLTASLHSVVGHELIRTRDVEGDVGTTVSTPQERSRSTLSEVASAAAGRLQQSMRCIEECCKLFPSNAAADVERLRYTTYGLNAKLQMALQRDSEFLDNARLYVLADCKLELTAFEDRVAAISEAGMDLIQIRDKDSDAQTLLSYLDAAARVVDPVRTRLIINDRVDIAAISAAHGVHLGQTDIGLADARKLLPITSWVGVSTHNPAQYAAACLAGADYVGCGPTFSSQTKQFDEFAGLDYLTAVAAEETCPAFAIGGINLSNIEQVLSTGIKRVAVAGAIWNADDPQLAASQMRGQL